MSRQNASESFRQKVKQFFGVKKGHAIPSSVYEGPKADDRVFHHELLQVSFIYTPGNFVASLIDELS